MNTYILNGSSMQTREDAHAEIARAMNFPEYYGANLDALWDMISCMDGEVIIENSADMLNALKKYGCRILNIFFDAAADNENFILRLA